MEPKPIDFTAPELYIVHCYRSEQSAYRWLPWTLDFAIAAASIGFVVFFVVGGELIHAFVAYGLVFGRWCHLLAQSARWNPHVRSVIAKYDKRIAELTDASNRTDRADAGDRGPTKE